MSKKKTKNQKRSAKKAVVLGEDKGKRLHVFYPIAAVCLVLIVAGAFGFIKYKSGSDAAVQADDSASDRVREDVVSFPVSLFEDGEARHFNYRHGDDTIRFFVLKSSDGIIRAAFDACDVCWPAGKGYFQEGDDMVCRNCGRRFASLRINEVQGGCNPAPLKRSIADGQLIIRTDDIAEGMPYFDFSGRS
ncbi:Fe-S-containing protein [Thermodesulfobacteriota bacterium]